VIAKMVGVEQKFLLKDYYGDPEAAAVLLHDELTDLGIAILSEWRAMGDSNVPVRIRVEIGAKP
jgi:hypothetical protein